VGASGLKRTAIGLATVGESRLDSPPCFPARHGLGIAWVRLEHHPSETPGLDSVTALVGQNGEIAQGEVAVDALVDATERPVSSNGTENWNTSFCRFSCFGLDRRPYC